MTDPTPEERLAKMSYMEIAELDLTASKVQVVRYVEALTLQKIRAAVEAKLKEMVEGITVEHGHCSVCDRVVAAIRARGESK
jgi:hypothetical protein